MSLKSKNEVETNKHELVVEVDAETFKKGVQKTYIKENKKISIPGFRKGKAPRKFVEQHYGKTVFYEGAVNETYSEALTQAIKESELNVIPNSVNLELGDVDDNGYSFTATVYTFPTVNIDNYKGIEIEKKSEEVTDEDINKAIDEAREKVARFITVEGREAKKDDVVTIDFKGFVNDEPFDGGESENYSLTLGSGQFIPGFEEQIIGHKVEDEFDVNVKFPDDYHAEQLKGKEAKFEVKLHEIKEKELPEFDDEFVKDISEFDTVDEYKKDLIEKLSKQKKNEAEENINEQISNKIVELIDADIPQVMYENKIDDDLREFEYRLKSQGLDIDNYMKYTGMNKQAMRDGFKDKAERQVKLRLALEKMAELEDLKASEEDLDNEYKKIADNYKMEVEKAKMFINADDLSKDIAVDKALKLVRDEAKIK